MPGKSYQVRYEGKEEYIAKVLTWNVNDEISNIWKINLEKPNTKGKRGAWKEIQNSDLRRYLNDCLRSGQDELPGVNIPSFVKFKDNNPMEETVLFQLLNLKNFEEYLKQMNTFSFRCTHHSRKIYFTRLRGRSNKSGQPGEDQDQDEDEDDSGLYYDTTYVALYDKEGNFVDRVAYDDSQIEFSEAQEIPPQQKRTQQPGPALQVPSNRYRQNLQTLFSPGKAFEDHNYRQNLQTLFSVTKGKHK